MSADKFNCAQCGLGHALLGVRFANGTLIRRVRGDKHRLRILGGAFAFNARFWDAHRGEFDEVLIKDTASGRVWYAGPNALDKAVRKTLDPFAGEQVILPLSLLEETRAWPARPGAVAEPDARAAVPDEKREPEAEPAPHVQLVLLQVAARDPGRQKRRPRAPKQGGETLLGRL